ncbi:hypothetical protein CLF_101991 [Clonorchis sinensis]|uniref:Reverse transcriptase domain-containing protein n=1 Tax=Clonorchis sinensis TaxID=79923 RepID=G7Y717_CLOSI|nr:hypothetical protein CLF_101991 [Clonorchis sinensis]
MNSLKAPYKKWCPTRMSTLPILLQLCCRTLQSLQSPGFQIDVDANLVDVEYAEDIILIFEESEAQALLNKQIIIIPSFGVRLPPSTCKVMLQNVHSLNMLV